MHVPANRPRLVRKRRGKESTDGGRQTDRAGWPCPLARRTRTLFQPLTTASVDAQPPTRHGLGSTSFLLPAVSGAQLPTLSTTTPSAPSLHFLCSFLFSFFAFCLSLSPLDADFACHFNKALLTASAANPLVDAALAAMNPTFATQAGHMNRPVLSSSRNAVCFA